MAEISAQEGQLAQKESEVLKNLFRLRVSRVSDAMTPRTVVFSLPETTTVEAFFHDHEHVRFSRIPVYSDERDHIEGFVLRSDLLLAQARGLSNDQLHRYRREMPVLHESLTLSRAFNEMLRDRTQIAQVVDEFGSTLGILTLEDIIETLLGLEIVDEGDEQEDMQEYARRLWKSKARKMGLDVDADKDTRQD